MKDCPYCNDKEIQARIIYKDNLAMVFPTNIPIVPGHLLILPIRHVANFSDLTAEEKEAIFDLREKLVPVLKKLFSAEAFNYAWNEGKIAGQSVPHFHLHMLPRYAGDTGITEYEPRKFLYRSGERETTPEIELQKIAKLIKKNLK